MGRELGTLSDRLATLKQQRSRRKNSLLAADRWMLSGLLAVAVALTAHWLRLLDLSARSAALRPPVTLGPPILVLLLLS